MVVGGYYLPPSLDLAICRESLLIVSKFADGKPTGVLIKNSRT